MSKHNSITIKIENETDDAIAFIHNEPAKYGFTLCYAHVGQHSEAQDTYMRYDCRYPQSPQDVIKAYELVKELESIGYIIEE